MDGWMDGNGFVGKIYELMKIVFFDKQIIF